MIEEIETNAYYDRDRESRLETEIETRLSLSRLGQYRDDTNSSRPN